MAAAHRLAETRPFQRFQRVDGAKLCRFRAFSMGFPWFSPRFPHEGPFTSTAHVFLIAKKKHQWPEEHRMSRSPLGLESRSPSRMSKVRGTLGGPTE